MKRLLFINVMLCLGVAAAYPSDFDFGESVASITDIRTRTSRISQSFQTLIDTLSYDANGDILILIRHTDEKKGLDGVAVEDLFTEPRCKRFSVIRDSITIESLELPKKTHSNLRREMKKLLNNDVFRWPTYGTIIGETPSTPSDNWLFLVYKKNRGVKEYLRFNNPSYLPPDDLTDIDSVFLELLRLSDSDNPLLF